MKTRELFEDGIHEVISKCLPHIEKSNIRPAYLKTKMVNPFAVNRIDAHDSGKDGLDAVRNLTDIVYFWLHFDRMAMLSTVVSGNKVGSLIPFNLVITIYGENSMVNAIRLKSFIRHPQVVEELLSLGMVVVGEPTLDTFPEYDSGEWWERTDISISLHVKVEDFHGGANEIEKVFGIGYSTATGEDILVEVKD